MKGKLRAVLAMAVVALAAAGAAWWGGGTGSPEFRLEPKPDRNVLLVTIDTLRADVVGAYGGRALTPVLDALAARGARFDFAHAHAVVTLPSHASILTGRYPYEHGIRDNTGYRLAPTQPTLATLFEAQGFATGAFVGGFPLDAQFGLASGFDVYDDTMTAASGPEPGDRERRADAVVASAVEWIGRQPGKWLSWVHVYDPHVTYAAPKDWAERFPGEPYLAEVSWTDSALARLFAQLESQRRPTLVVVTADHGEGLGDHGELTHGIFAYEAMLRVPLIIAEYDPTGDAKPPRGVTISSAARHVDLLPTILGAVSAPVPAGLPGASLQPAIAGSHGEDRPSYFEAMSPAVTRSWAPLRGVLAGREKYIDLPIQELYDLAADPAESSNLATSRAARAHELFTLLKRFNVAPPARARVETAETLDRLRSLGYIGGGTAIVKDKYTEEDDPKRLIALEQAMQRAAEAWRQGRAEEAARLYREVIEKRRDMEDAYRKLALVHWRSGNARAAIATLELALKNGVTQSEVRNRLAQYLAESGQPARAIALIEHDAGDDPDALVALGNAQMMVGRHADAIRTFTRLVALDPAMGLAHQNLGIAHLQSRHFPAAEDSLKRALQLDPTLAGAHTALGVVYANTGRRDQAIAEWQRALQLDPVDANALANLRAIQRQPSP